MRKLVVGVFVGGVPTMGVASAIPNPGDWVQAPMMAREFTTLGRTGHCPVGMHVEQVGERLREHYACRADAP